MIIYNFNKYIEKTFPPSDVFSAISYYNYDKSRIEELVKKRILDFAFACHEKGRLHKIDVLLGLTPGGGFYDQIRAVQCVIAYNYLNELLDKKYIKKFHIIKLPFKHSGKKLPNARIKACISLIPRKTFPLYERKPSPKREELLKKYKIT